MSAQDGCLVDEIALAMCGKCRKWLHEFCTMYGLFCNTCGRDKKRKENATKTEKQ
jgi:exosome complex RNA-binding protein Csl4